MDKNLSNREGIEGDKEEGRGGREGGGKGGREGRGERGREGKVSPMRVRPSGSSSSYVFLVLLDSLVVRRGRAGVDGMCVLSSPVVVAM